MPRFAHHSTKNTLGKFFQVIDRRSTHFRQVGTVTDMHPVTIFPVRVKFPDGGTQVYHAYQLRRVVTKRTKSKGASV